MDLYMKPSPMSVRFRHEENSPDAFQGRGGLSMVVAVAVFSSLATRRIENGVPLAVQIRGDFANERPNDAKNGCPV